MSDRLDSVGLAIAWDRLISIADEMLISIVRTAFSVGVRECWDAGCVLFDGQGRSIAQGTFSMPAFIGTAPGTLKAMLAKFPRETLVPGDVVVTNDPWLGTGHVWDICVMRPVFKDARLVGYVMTISHLQDIGARGLAIDATQVYEEGIVLPVCKLFKAGEPNEELFDLIRTNVRTVEQVIGDLMADVAGNEVGARLFVELLDEMGLASIDEIADAIIEQSEAAMRRRIQDIPDGVYRNTILVEGQDGDVRLACAVTVSGDEVAIDFTGSGDCVDHAVNVPFCYTVAFSAYSMKCLTTPDIPNNEGALRPVRIHAPEGCILNAPRPRATGVRHTIGWFIVPLITGALAEALPHEIQSDSGMASLCLVHGHTRDGRELASQYFLAGGVGAMAGLDGAATTPSPTNNATISSEVWENETGTTVRMRRLLADSGGAGEFRGGVGQEVEIRNDSDNAIAFSVFGLRARHPARGFSGGRDGSLRRFRVDGETVAPKGRYVLAPGQTIHFMEAGGGGYGDPAERDPGAVLRDVIDGFVSVEGALGDYGVEVDLDAGTAERVA